MTENKTYKWMGVLNGVILILIWVFHLREKLPALASIVLLPNIIALIVIKKFEKKDTVESLAKETVANLTIINNISENGFEISNRDEKININWKDINSI